MNLTEPIQATILSHLVAVGMDAARGAAQSIQDKDELMTRVSVAVKPTDPAGWSLDEPPPIVVRVVFGGRGELEIELSPTWTAATMRRRIEYEVRQWKSAPKLDPMPRLLPTPPLTA